MKMHLSETYFLAEKPLKWAILLKIKRLNRLYAQEKMQFSVIMNRFFRMGQNASLPSNRVSVASVC